MFKSLISSTVCQPFISNSSLYFIFGYKQTARLMFSLANFHIIQKQGTIALVCTDVWPRLSGKGTVYLKVKTTIADTHFFWQLFINLDHFGVSCSFLETSAEEISAFSEM